MDFHEELPAGCPPLTAVEIVEQQEVFRLVASNPPSEWDFQSHATRSPEKKYSDACMARAISVLKSQDHALQTLKLPKMKGCLIGRVTLQNGSGMIKQTGHADHYSWWRASGYNPLEDCEVLT